MSTTSKITTYKVKFLPNCVIRLGVIIDKLHQSKNIMAKKGIGFFA